MTIQEKVINFGIGVKDKDLGKIVRRVAVGIAVVAGVGTTVMYFGVIKPINESSRIREFNSVYEKALFQYADTNEDRIISAYEQDEFDRKLLTGKGVTLKHDSWPKYEDGNKVPKEVVIDWIRNYKE